jgi:membrane-associated protease RseP (regulator of RpoE activity)
MSTKRLFFAVGLASSVAFAQQPPVVPGARPEAKADKPIGAITFPREDFGLKPGDTIVEIDGQAVTPIEGSSKLYADSNRIKTVTVLRDGHRTVLKRKGH